MTFGPCQETSYTAITLNPESNFTRREKNHSLFHWHTLTLPEPPTQEFGCHARKPHQWLLEYRWIKRFVWFLDRFHWVYSIRWETSRRIYVVRERLTKRQATSRPDHLWPGLWIKLGRNAKLKEKQKWSNEKPKLDNARRSRGIYFIDPEDKEFKETIQNARKKLETPMAPAVPCKTCKKNKYGETPSKTNDFKSKFACILEASESTRLRMEESLPKYHEDHIAGKGDNSLQHYNLAHKFIPMPQAMKIPATKAAVDKEWEKLEKISAWNLTKVRSKSEVIDEARTKGAKVHFASLMDICHLKNAELETKHQKYQGRNVLRGDIMKDDSGSYAVFTTSSGRSICSYPCKMEDAPKLLKIPNSECPDIWIRLLRHKWPKSWSSMEDPVVFLERNLSGSSFVRTVMGKAIWGDPFETWLGESFQVGNVFSLTKKKDYSYLCMWMTSNCLERSKILIRCGKYST